MAEAPSATPTPDPVAGLIDIPLPREVSLWPQTWESRIAIILLVAAALAAIWRFAHLRRVNRYRRDALAELSRIEHARDSELLSKLTLLVRRTALAAFPREQVASLVGPAWLSFLDRSYGGDEFSHGVGRLLVSGPYRQLPPDGAELQSLMRLVRHWIRGHHG